MAEKKLVQMFNSELQDHTPEETLKILSERFRNRIIFTTSFGYEDQVITDMIFRHKIPVRIATLDTGRLFEETYKVFARTRERYQCTIETYFPDTRDVEKLLSAKGPISFYESVENRKECCHIRKVKPLGRALKGNECWITGLRASQSENRSSLSLFDWDSKYRIIKYNPLLLWNLEKVKNYIKKYNVPYNALHDKGFESIGCEPCTRAVKQGEDIRAGRWWWEKNTGKECGLHMETDVHNGKGV